MCYNYPMLPRWMRLLTMGDMVYLMAFGLLAPVFALFLKQQIPGVTLMSVGLAEAVFLLTLGLIRPFAELSCKNDFRGLRAQKMLWFGSVLAICAPFFYLMARDMVDIYVIQALYGVGLAFSEPAWDRMEMKTCHLASGPIWFRLDAFGALLAAGLALLGGTIAQNQGMGALLAFFGVTLLLASALMAVAYRRLALNKAHGSL